MKNKIIILTTIIVNVISIGFNLMNFFKGNFVTSFNLIVSIIYLFTWIILFLYAFIKKDKIFCNFMYIYWLISTITSISSIKISSAILIPFYIIFFAPFYGFSQFLNLYVPQYSFLMSFISIFFLILATCINKYSKYDNGMG